MSAQIKLDNENKNFKVMVVEGTSKDAEGKDVATPVIVAGTVKEDNTWNEPHEVTEEVISAVRDYLFSMYNKDKNSVGFKWETDTLEVQLVLRVIDKNKNGNETASESEN